MNRLPHWTMSCFIVAGLLIVPRSAIAQHTVWHTSLHEAEAAAERDGLPLLIHFHAWYCGPCRQMDSQVFHHSDVQAALSDGLHAIQIDVTQDQDAAGRFGATTVPRDVVVYSDGSTETLNIGFVSRNSYLSMLHSIASKGEVMRSEQVPLPHSPNSAIAANGARNTNHDIANVDPLDTTASDTETVLGLNGFCPVRLASSREWVKGDSNLTGTWRGVTYYFATDKDRRDFEKQPTRFAPQNLGCDPVVLYNDQRAISGQIEYGAFFDGHLYLFESQTNRDDFKKNPLRYTRIRHAVRVDQIEGRRVL